MLQLLDFLYRQRIFLLFLLLEGISIWLIFSYNHRYNTYFLNSSNRISGEISQAIGSVDTFFDLQRANRALAEENLQFQSSNRTKDQIEDKERRKHQHFGMME